MERPHRINEDVAGAETGDPKMATSVPVFLRALEFTLIHDLEKYLARHAEFEAYYATRDPLEP